MTCLSQQKDGTILLTVYIQPRASRNRIAGLHGDALKICITAPPVDNKANGAVIDFLSKFFKISKSNISIKSGKQSRTKHVTIAGLSATAARRFLDNVLEE